MTVQKYVLVSGALVHVIGNGDYVKAREYDALVERVKTLEFTMRNTASWLNNRCNPGDAATELLLVAGPPVSAGDSRS